VLAAVKTVGRGCDVCQSVARRRLHEQRFVTFDGSAGLLGGYTVVSCAQCGFVYADDLPELAVFERYYREMSKHEPQTDVAEPPAYKRHNCGLIVEQFSRRLPQRNARILDVGIGSGEVLLALRERGYTNVTGLDPSPRAAEVMQRRAQIRVINTPINQMESSKDRFDVIILSGVVEHLRDLRPTLTLLKGLLAPNGLFCIAVPDANRFADYVESPYQYFSVEHINFFTLRSLETLLATVGMRMKSSWEVVFLLGTMHEPAISAIFEIGDVPAEIVADTAGPRAVARYVEESRQLADRVTANVHKLSESGVGIIIWGAGSLTMNMLSFAQFERLNVVAFVDANPNYWDKTIRGRPVLKPERVRDYDETILVVSYSYEAEICHQIANELRLRNPVVRLFGSGTPAAEQHQY
jgi:SAM-dependent methyltransferase